NLFISYSVYILLGLYQLKIHEVNYKYKARAESQVRSTYTLFALRYSQILNSDNHSLNIQLRAEALQITRLT
ncbi:hypothetical protein VIGAN_07245000, partial [Vigna angularis var. angularis]